VQVTIGEELEPAHVKFAELAKVEPKDGVSDEDLPIVWNPELMARLVLAAKACRREREPGEKESSAVPGVALTTLGGYLDPCWYTIGGEFWDTAVHTAYVTIMPMNLRAKGSSGDKLAKEQARERAQAKREAAQRKEAKAQVAKIAQERTKAARAEAKAVEKRNREQREPRASDVPAAVASVASIGEQIGIDRTRQDELAARELARLSAPKLAELWTDRDAQKQVLSNVLSGRNVTREARARIRERMAGRPLSDLGFIVAAVLGASGEVAA